MDSNELSYTEEFGESIAEVRKAMSSYNPRDKQRQQIGETVRFLNRYKQSSYISDYDEQFVETWIERGQHVLHRALRINDSLCFRNFLSNMKDNKYQAFNRAMGIAVSFDAVVQSSHNLNDSLWRETKYSLEKFLEDAETIFKKENSAYGNQTWFVLLNLLEAIDSKGNEPQLLQQYQRLAAEYDDALNTCMKKSPGLRVYAHDLSAQDLLPISIRKVTSSERREFDSRTVLFDVLARLRREESISESILSSSEPPNKPHLWGIAKAWIRSQKGNLSGVIPYYQGINADYIFRNLFEPEETDLATISVSDEELATVSQMDDDEIQSILIDLLKNNSHLKEVSRVSLQQERDKPHAGGEISDFDIEITLAGNEDGIFVSFPIKSGVEAGNRTTEQLAEANLHQLLRPLTRFTQCAVFPILVAGTSLNLQEVLKTLRSQYNLPIKFIDKNLFAKVLKVHGHIQRIDENEESK